MKQIRIVFCTLLLFFFMGAAQAQSTPKITVIDVAKKRQQMEGVRTKAKQQVEQDNLRIKTGAARTAVLPVGSNAAAPDLQRTKPVLKKGERQQ